MATRLRINLAVSGPTLHDLVVAFEHAKDPENPKHVNFTSDTATVYPAFILKLSYDHNGWISISGKIRYLPDPRSIRTDDDCAEWFTGIYNPYDNAGHLTIEYLENNKHPFTGKDPYDLLAEAN